jgi:hypothetical protein
MRDSMTWAELEASGYSGPTPREALASRRRRGRPGATLAAERRSVKVFLTKWSHDLKNNPGRNRWTGRCPVCGTGTHKKYCSDRCSRRANLLKTYGITPEQFDAMLEAQGGACKICRSATSGVKGRTWHIDHDHSCCDWNPRDTGVALCGKCVRGILCVNCNTGLGMFRDSPEALEAAAEYLRAWESPGRSL